MSKTLEEIKNDWWHSKHSSVEYQIITTYFIHKSIDEWIKMLYDMKKSGYIDMNIMMDENEESVCLQFKKIVEESEKEYMDRVRGDFDK